MRRLLIRPGAIGDFILSLPAMEGLKAVYTEVWARSEVLPLVRFADRVRSIAGSGLNLIGVTEPPLALVDELRGFDSIVSWHGANRPEFRDAVAALGLPFRFFPALPPEGCEVHASDFYLAQARELMPVCSNYITHLDCLGARGDFAVIHPFSGSPKKCWPLDRFRELARRLAMPVAWCAGPEETLESAVRFDDLGDLAGWLATARLYIGNDSGITHLAAAVGTPVVALFGPTDPRIWAPRGPDVRILARPRLDLIEVDDVIATIRNR